MQGVELWIGDGSVCVCGCKITVTLMSGQAYIVPQRKEKTTLAVTATVSDSTAGISLGESELKPHRRSAT